MLDQQAGADAEREADTALAEIEQHYGGQRQCRYQRPRREVTAEDERAEADEQQYGQADIGPARARATSSRRRAYQAGQREQQRVFPDVGEDRRRDQRIEDAAEHPAERDVEVEFGQVRDRRAAPRELAVAHHRGHEKQRQMQQQQPDAVQRRRDHDERDDQERLQSQHQPMRQRRPAGEREDEGQQIQRERDHPEQRRRGEVGRDMRGDCQQQGRRDKGEGDPAQPLGPRRRYRSDMGDGLCGRMAAIAEPAHADAGGNEGEPERPGLALRRQRQVRLDQQRIGEKRDQAAGITGGVEEIGVGGRLMVGAREPALQQRRCRRDREERRADADRQPADQPQHRNAIGRRRRAGQIKRQKRRGGEQHGAMDQRLRAPLEPRRQQMRVEIAAQQRRLEKAHAGVPHARRPAEARQHHLGDHRLHEEQQACAEKQRSGIARQQQPRRERGLRCRKCFRVRAHGAPHLWRGSACAHQG